jgi:hypothetical protein
MLSSGMTGLCGSSTFSFFKNSHKDFYNGCTVYILFKNVLKFPLLYVLDSILNLLSF